jgi:hypothetical protein
VPEALIVTVTGKGRPELCGNAWIKNVGVDSCPPDRVHVRLQVPALPPSVVKATGQVMLRGSIGADIVI